MLWIIGDGDELNTLKSMVKDKKLEKNIISIPRNVKEMFPRRIN